MHARTSQGTILVVEVGVVLVGAAAFPTFVHLVHLPQVLEVLCGVVEVGVDTDLQRKTLYETERNANANIPSRRALWRSGCAT